MRTPSVFAAAVLAAVALAVGLPGPSATAGTVAGLTAATGTATTSLTAATSTATPTPSASSSADSVTVSVSPVDSGVLTATSDLTVGITVHNGTSTALDSGTLSLFLDRTSFATRSDLDDWFDRPDSTTTDTLGMYLTSAAVDPIAAHASSAEITVTVPAVQLGLMNSGWGAKAFGVRYSSGGQAVAEKHSSLTYESSAGTGGGTSSSPDRSLLSVAVPLTVPATSTGLIGAGALAAYTAPNGLLTEELKAVRGKPVALGIDPMIVASIRILGNAAPPSAVEWLNSLTTAPNQTFALAYGDTDLSALRQAGAQALPNPIDFTAQIAAQAKSDPTSYVDNATTAPATPTGSATSTATATGSHKDTAKGTTKGTAKATSPATATNTPAATAHPTGTVTPIPATGAVPTTASLLAFAYTLKGVAWPLDSTVATDDLSAFSTNGYTTTLLSSDNVSASSDSTTAGAHATVSGHAALVSDGDLTTELREAVAAGSDAEWRSDMTRLAADLATLQYESPTTSRSLFATLDRGWATTGSRLAQTLTALSKLTSVSTTTMTNTLAAKATTESLSAKKASSARIAALQPLAKADSDLQQFSTALSQPELVTAPERLRMLGLASTAWADDPTGLAPEIAKNTASVGKTTNLVKIRQGSPISILGDRSSLPVYVQNDTASEAVVTLQVTPSNYFLNIVKNDISVTVPANSQQRITVPVQSVANGKVGITLTLTSRTGVAIASPVRVAISVQAGWETAITLIFGIAVVLLFGGGIIRSLRRRRRAAAAAGAAGVGADGDSASADSTPPASSVPPADEASPDASAEPTAAPPEETP